VCWRKREARTGVAVHVYWQFDEDAMDDDEGNLDWSISSVDRIVYA
jgi:hypothetical protein